MLFMLMFLGLLPAGLAHAADGGDRDDAQGPEAGDAAAGQGEAGPDDGAARSAGDLLDLPGDNPAQDGADGLPAPDDDAFPGEVVAIGADSGDVSIRDFRPGMDRLELRLAPDETRFESITDPESGAPGLQLSTEDDDRQILFPGLAALPVDDITLTRDDGDGLAVFRLQEPAGSDPLLPLPGDGEDQVTPAEEDDAALQPLDPEAEEIVTPGAGEPGLAPLPGDGEEVVTPAAAGLQPVASAPDAGAAEGPGPSGGPDEPRAAA